MANTYKNIVITPNRDTDAANVPSIRFSGGDGTSNTDINVRVYTTQSGTLSFEGSAGQLFSITNDLTNTIFSVNDVSGIPSLEIDASGKIIFARYGGNVGIGTSTPNTALDVVGNISSSNTIFALFFDSISDIAYKENVKPITNPIEILSQLNPVSFDWKTSKIKSYGLIAQEVEKILPSIVHEKPDGTKTVNYIEIIAFLIQAIKHQQQQIDNINNNRTA